MMQYLEYNKNIIKWDGKSPINKTFLIAPMGPKSPIMIFNASGDLLLEKETEGFPCDFTQLDDLSGYSYFSGAIQVGPSVLAKYHANGRYTIGKLYITDNELNIRQIVDYIPTNKKSNVIGLHMHGNKVLGDGHYWLQAISLEDVLVDGKQTYVVNCILQEQLNGQVVWEWQSIDAPQLFFDSFDRNDYFNKQTLNKEFACDYAHMNSAVKTKDGKYVYISFKHIGIVKLDYNTKEIIWVIGPNAKKITNYPRDTIFGHQHDIHLINDNTIYFWDNNHCAYVEMCVEDNTITSYRTHIFPTKCKGSVMGNVLRLSEDVYDVCYGWRFPLSPSIYYQPIVSEFDIKTNKKLLDITIHAKNHKLINIIYQINRGVNIYESQ